MAAPAGLPHDPDKLIALLIKRAPELIAVGVTSLSIEGMSATLSKPAPAPGPVPDKRPVARQHVNPMQDPATYPGGVVPGFTRDEDKTT